MCEFFFALISYLSIHSVSTCTCEGGSVQRGDRHHQPLHWHDPITQEGGSVSVWLNKHSIASWFECFFAEILLKRWKSQFFSCLFSLSQLLVSLAMFPRWWFQIVFIFISTWGYDAIGRSYFSMGLVGSTGVSSFLASGVALAKQPLKWSKLV